MRKCLLLAAALTLFAVPRAQAAENPVIVIATSMGDIKVELYQDKAPVTVKNMLDYADNKFYDGTVFHRVIPGFMIQGGGMEESLKEKKTRDAIKNESSNGLVNTRGTIAMARTPDPNSATAQFFINLKDNEFLDRAKARDKVGYCVFGKVTEGMDIVDKIAGVKTGPKGKFDSDVPQENVVIKSIRRAGK